MLVKARGLIDMFQAMNRKKFANELDALVTEAASLVTSFASGIRGDRAAVHAGITEPRSNGQT